MNLPGKLPVLAALGGVVLGAAIFLAVRAWVPMPLTNATSGAFSPSQLMSRLFVLVPVVAGLGGAGMAWLAYHLSDWTGSSRWLGAIIFGATTGAVAVGLAASFLPDAPKGILMILTFTGPGALVGCSLCWWVADASSSDLP